MPAFLYFASETNDLLTEESVNKLGLSHAFRHGGSISCRKSTRGPSGKQGMVFANKEMLGEAKLGYYPDDQLWQNIPDDGDEPSKVWIGHISEKLPSPDDLAYQKQLPGVSVELGGQSWLIPLVKRYHEEEGAFFDGLPQKTRRRGDGKWVLEGVMGEYQAIYQESKLVFDAIMDDEFGAAEESYGVNQPRETKPNDIHNMIDLTCRLIGLNYAVDVWEGSLLGFADHNAAEEALYKAFDIYSFYEAIKKKAAEQQSLKKENSTLGSEESTRITTPV